MVTLAGQPFGFDQQTYNDMFVSELAPYYSKFLFWDKATMTSAHYMCFDAARADRLVDWVFDYYQIQFPTWVVKIFTKSLYLFSIDGVAVLSNARSVSPNIEYYIGAYAKQYGLTDFDLAKDLVKYTC